MLRFTNTVIVILATGLH